MCCNFAKMEGYYAENSGGQVKEYAKIKMQAVQYVLINSTDGTEYLDLHKHFLLFMLEYLLVMLCCCDIFFSTHIRGVCCIQSSPLW